MMLKYLFAIFSFLLIFKPTVLANEPYYKGIDISAYQGQVNFEELASSGIEYLYIRAGEGGTMVDSDFQQHYQGAQSQNLHYGFYYVVTAKNSAAAESQAEHFASLISGLSYSLRPAMDFEEFSDLTVAESNEIALAFLEKLAELSQVTPAIYSDAYNVKTRWRSDFSAYPLWVADYAHLAEPETYVLVENENWDHWSGYQYTDSAVIAGIEGNVDGDLFTTGLILSSSEENTSSDSSENTTETSLFYSVKTGDTLWQISQKFQSSVATLAEVNQISNVNLIYPGEELKIPMNESYTVQAGDTLTKIAHYFHTTVDILAEGNGISDINLIYVGETLYLPSSLSSCF